MAVAIARYYFYSVTDSVAPLLNLANSGSGSDAINKVVAAHLCSHTYFCLARFIVNITHHQCDNDRTLQAIYSYACYVVGLLP